MLGKSLRGAVALLGALSIVLAANGSVLAAHKPQKSGSGATFTNFELAATPPQPAGTICPNTAGTCQNNAAEPQIRADGAGRFYASSENGFGSGTIAWKSEDGGHHYASLLSPNIASSTQTPVFGSQTFAPGGGDTDVATAPALNSNGLYNVYVASLSLANVDVSTSQDAGQTWKLNPLSATIPVDDREWIAADDSSKVCVSYHDIATSNIDVNCSYDSGTTFTQLGGAIDVNHLWLLQNNGSGNLAIDPSSHVIYQVFSGIANATEAVCTSCGLHVVWVAVSTDGGRTFTDYPIYDNPDTTASYNHQFVDVTIDRAGNLYAVYTDNHSMFYSFSTDQGATWSGPFKVNAKPADTAIFPWAAAGSAGHLDVVFYGSSYFHGGVAPDNYPSSASWYVYFAQNLNALSPGSRFSQTQASPIVHYGGVCEGGISCLSGNRDLYDDFGVAVSPLTGLASIVYSDDQYTNDANDPPAGPYCTQSQSNSALCDHTTIATQISGSGV